MNSQRVVIFWIDFDTTMVLYHVSFDDARKLAVAVGSEQVVSVSFKKKYATDPSRTAYVDMKTVKMVTYGDSDHS